MPSSFLLTGSAPYIRVSNVELFIYYLFKVHVKSPHLYSK
jgi:hypothetical protein